MSSNGSYDKNVSKGIEKIINVVKSFVSNMAEIKNKFKSVASTLAQTTKQITKLTTVVEQPEKSWAKGASRDFKRKTLYNNVLATEVAKKWTNK